MARAAKIQEGTNKATMAMVADAVRKCEAVDGHQFSGTGLGLSMFLNVWVNEGGKSVRYMEYGNGVDLAHVRFEMKNVPGLERVEGILD